MQLIKLKQRSLEWLEWRRNKIMASDAPIIMGASLFKDPLTLLDEKINAFEPFPNKHMKRGNDLEPIALEDFEKCTGLTMFPCVGLHENGWLGASFDGMTIEGDIFVEIKCPGKKDHTIAMKGKIPPKYIHQCQTQCYVSGLDKGYYYSFHEKSSKIIEFKRDNEIIDNMIVKLFDFWQILMTKKFEQGVNYAIDVI